MNPRRSEDSTLRKSSQLDAFRGTSNLIKSCTVNDKAQAFTVIGGRVALR